MTPFHPKLRRALLRDSQLRNPPRLNKFLAFWRALARDPIVGEPRATGSPNILKRIFLAWRGQPHQDRASRLLTPARLQDYEGLLAKLYYLEKYPDPDKRPNTQKLFEEILQFHNKFMPNFATIHDRWLDGQKRAIQGHYHVLDPIELIKAACRRLVGWWKSRKSSAGKRQDDTQLG